MAVRSATRSQRFTVTSLCGDIEPRLEFAGPWQSALATGLPSRRKNCFVLGQVLSLCADANNLWLGDWCPLGWAGRTTGFLATPLLLCTAASRGKDGHYRGVFRRTGGEICFWWTELWTERNKSTGRLAFQWSSGSNGLPAKLKAVAHCQLLRLGSWITTSSETASTQVCPSNWIRSAE